MVRYFFPGLPISPFLSFLSELKPNGNPPKSKSLSHPIHQISLIRRMDSPRMVGIDDKGGRTCGDLGNICQIHPPISIERRGMALHPRLEVLIDPRGGDPLLHFF
jgi:hypothetical protein